MAIWVHPAGEQALIHDQSRAACWALEGPRLIGAAQPGEGLRATAVRADGGVVATARFADETGEWLGPFSSPLVVDLLHWGDLAPAGGVTIPDTGVNITGLALSPDGRWLAAADMRERIFLVELATGRADGPMTWTSPTRSAPVRSARTAACSPST
jgi:hypothetical protein